MIGAGAVNKDATALARGRCLPWLREVSEAEGSPTNEHAQRYKKLALFMQAGVRIWGLPQPTDN